MVFSVFSSSLKIIMPGDLFILSAVSYGLTAQHQTGVWTVMNICVNLLEKI